MKTITETIQAVTNRRFRLLLSLVLFIGIMVTACNEPTGYEGPQGQEGPQGEVGPVGPAGEDGSTMYAGEGDPTADIGQEGDYYLNTTTGEYYGPKDGDGWGNPIIVLKGEDGTDGRDGEDGTKIHSGDGVPDASLGVAGDFYMDRSSQDLYGPKTDSGWGDPISLNGEDGQDGADGQDGTDGRVIHSGQGAPSASLGSPGDFYFDEHNGDFYGPKTENGWGSPTNLTGEDGQDGADGQDGEDGVDGQDGSQIHAGEGAPDASLGAEGDYYLDKANYDLYGPKTSDGWGTPINIKGAQGNANVTRYIFNGHDYSEDADSRYSIDVPETESRQSAWLVYLIYRNMFNRPVYFSVPGLGVHQASQYHKSHTVRSDRVELTIGLVDGPGEAYTQIEIVRIEAGNTVDNRPIKLRDAITIIPDHLDTSNYEEVAEYYGLN